jgi:hypothetical protein
VVARGGEDEQPERTANRLHVNPRRLRERLCAIQTLTREALLGYERNGFKLALRYAPDAIERVRAMVTGEQHCCAFLEFEVREQSDAVHVTITAPQNARDAAAELFEQFIAGVEPQQR